MTQNEVNIIKNAVLDATEAYVDARLSSADFVKTQIGVVSGTPTKRNNKYYHTVRCDNGRVQYTNVLSVGNIEFENGSVVFLLAPNAQFSNQFILGKLDDTAFRVDSIGIGGTSGNPAFSVDKQGNLRIGNYFSVTKDGVLSATSGTFSGTISSSQISNGQFSVTSNGSMTASAGQIAGFTIGSQRLSVGDTQLSTQAIATGTAGYGIAGVVGGRGGDADRTRGYLQLSNSGDIYNVCIDGIRIYGTGHILRTGGYGEVQWDKYLSNIPDKTIYEDPNTGYLRWA